MKTKFRISLSTFIIICIVATTLTLTINATINGNENSGNQINILESSNDYCKLEYLINEFQQEDIEISGEKLKRLSIEGEPALLLKGMPDLPKITRSISISGNAEMSINTIKSEYKEIEMQVAPSKGSLLRKINPATIPYEFSKIYNKDEFYPSSIAELGEPYIFRDQRGITVTIYPITYNPVKKIIRLYTNLVIEVKSINTNDTTTIKDIKKHDKTFDNIHNKHFINLSSRRYSNLEENGSMLIICEDSFIDEMQPFVDWKNQKGIPTTITGINSIGNDANRIKTYINNKYKSEDLTFVLLVGDSNHITSFEINDNAGSRTLSDSSYSLLDGNDSYPEIIIGRFSAENESDVKTQVNKTIFYERDLGNEPWRYKAIGLASTEGPGDDYEMDYQHIRKIRTDLLNYKYTHVDELYDGSQGGEDSSGDPSVSMCQNAINEGRGLINYIGHGDFTRWFTGRMNISSVNSLNNTNKLPIIFSVACLVGSFNGKTCFSESWLRAGTDTNFKGAVAMYGSSISQSWVEPMRAQDEFVDLLVAETKASFGALCYMGSSKMIDEGGEGSDTFKGWVIFGDPSLQIFPSENTTTPSSFLGDVNTDGTINVVDALLLAQYYVGGNPVNFNQKNADVNSDGSINITDALLISQYYVGIITSFPD